MSKYFKNLVVACLVVCMTVCLGVFATACTESDSSVSITVKLDDNTPVKDVEVQLCTTGEPYVCLDSVFTNAQGVATFELDEANGKSYEVHILSGIPTGYKYADSNGTAYTEGGMQINVSESSSYTITLVKVQ